MIRKGYIDTPLAGGLIQTHYRSTGSGPRVLVLHPSPMSSAFMVPVMQAIKGHCEVLAPDTPGYGQSEPLPQPGDDLQPYVAWLEALRVALGDEQLVIYGSATGAQIAIAYGLAYPQHVRHLVLDNAVHFEDAERGDIMAHYFPDLAPQADGAHLQTAWAMSRGLFRGFPWYREPTSPLPEPPLALVQATALAYLVAGPDYARAYKAAFNNERVEILQSVRVPTTVLRWDGSLLKDYADRLDAYAWPAHIQMKFSEATPAARFAALREAVIAALA